MPMEGESMVKVFAKAASLLAPLALVALVGAAPAAAQKPEQVQYLPGDGKVIVTWMAPSGNVTGYNVYQYEPTSTTDPGTSKKVNAEPTKQTSLLVEGLTNGKVYHFRVSAIVDGTESEQAGPAPGRGNDGEFKVGLVAPVVPQVPVKLAGIDGFVGHTIGTNTPGSHTIAANGEITIKAGGWDIWEEADGFYYLAVPIEGDVTVTVRVTAGPTATGDTGGGWELGGPMIRESLDSRSRFAMMQISNGRNNNAHQFKKRLEFDTRPENHDIRPASEDTTERPVWARIQRRGDNMRAWISEDGTNFVEAAEGETVAISNLPARAYVGLAWCAHNDTGPNILTEVKMDNFTITKP
jgi:hypothetical protein